MRQLLMMMMMMLFASGLCPPAAPSSCDEAGFCAMRLSSRCHEGWTDYRAEAKQLT